MMQLPLATCVLLAAGFDWLEALLPFFFVAFWIVSQVFSVFRRLQGGRLPENGRKPPPLPRLDPARELRRAPQPEAGDAADSRTDLERQIAEFLREVTGEKKPKPTVKKSEPVVAARPQPPRVAPGQGAQKKTPVTVRETAAPTADVAARERTDNTASVSRHVQDAFSHELTHLRGELVHDAPKAGVVPPPAAARQVDELVQLLRNPATIRQAILLREVIDRPVDRW
jgi:hypothetical protein